MLSSVKVGLCGSNLEGSMGEGSREGSRGGQREYGSNLEPMSSISAFQCLGLMAGLRRSVINGIVRLNASTRSFTQTQTAQDLISLPSFVTFLPVLTAASSISST
jgi:hypothetical protein